MENKYPNFRQYFSSQLWAVLPEVLPVMSEILARRVEGNTLISEEMQAKIRAGQSRTAGASSGTVAVIPIYGVIDQKVSMMQQISGGCSVDELMGNFRAALADKSVTAILFDIDSPGGSVSGIQEAATEIMAARGKKTIIAVANPMIASAAYWLACACEEIYCMPSGQVGSIGIIAVHDDVSAMNEIAGYKPTYITYGQYKAEGNPDAPLTEDARAYRQNQVNTVGNTFTAFVARARGLSVDKVRTEFGQGRMMLAKDAMAAGMIDGIATVEQAIQNIADGMKAFATPGLMADAQQAAEAMRGIGQRFSERRALREKTKGGLKTALTDSNKEAIEAALAATCEVKANVEDAESSLRALLDSGAPVTVEEQSEVTMVVPAEDETTEEETTETTEEGTLALERSRLELTMRLRERNNYLR